MGVSSSLDFSSFSPAGGSLLLPSVEVSGSSSAPMTLSCRQMVIVSMRTMSNVAASRGIARARGQISPSFST